MLTQAQEELLTEFLGSEGNYSQTILSDTNFNQGTKVLYLQRALCQNADDFLYSLDKLYNPSLDQQQHLEFLMSLKFINDIYHNSTIRYREKCKPALYHYFHGVGDGADPKQEDFSPRIAALINARVNELYSNIKEESLPEQIRNREQEEDRIEPNSRWRTQLDNEIQPDRTVIDNNRCSSRQSSIISACLALGLGSGGAVSALTDVSFVITGFVGAVVGVAGGQLGVRYCFGESQGHPSYNLCSFFNIRAGNDSSEAVNNESYERGHAYNAPIA